MDLGFEILMDFGFLQETSGVMGTTFGRGGGTWKREFKLPWREAGPPNHHDDKVDSDQ